MSYIIYIETSTKVCSVALSLHGAITTLKEIKDDKYIHAEKLNLLIDECILDSNISYKQLSAVAISSGPGSFTGLRIGVSTAKGLAYSLGIPLISVDSLTCIYHVFKSKNIVENTDIILPMIDARRQEVYTMGYSNGKIVFPISSQIIDLAFFKNFSNKIKLHLVGDGCEKFENKFNADNIYYYSSIINSAAGMVETATKKLKKMDFEDVAYFAPKYIKDFHFNWSFL